MADRPRGSRRPTLDDVAALAGVSRMVASRALNEQGNVSASATEKVRAAVMMLGYVRHQGARSLAVNKTGAIAFLAPMNSGRFFSDPNVALIMSGLKETLAGSHHHLVTLLVENDDDSERVGQYLRARHVDGAVILSPDLVKPLVRDLQRSEFPIAGNELVDGAEAMDALIFDTRAAARQVASHLRDRGVEELAVIAGPSDRSGTHLVLAGIRDVYSTLAPSMVRFTDHSFQAGQDATRDLLREISSFDGLFISSDTMASAAIQVLQAAGRHVPGDIKVTGWDNSLPADFSTPRLTTLDIPYRGVGERLGKMLLEQLSGTPGGRVEPIRTFLIRRDSA